MVYHDAKLAEVTQWDDARTKQQRHPYPNPKMLQENEKWQINEFLGRWLDHSFDAAVSQAPVKGVAE